MSENQADLVIQISDSGALPNAIAQGNGSLVGELRSRIQPGLQIVLEYPGYWLKGSVLWVCSDSPDHAVSAGVRLLSISARAEVNADVNDDTAVSDVARQEARA